jgi:hypothetical protein
MKTLFRLNDQPATSVQALAHFTAWFLDEDRPGFDWKRTAQDAESIFVRGAYKSVAHCRRMLESSGLVVTVVGLDEPGELVLTN